MFETRARIVAAIRQFLNARGFLEVETPMMQPIAGGALARPFVTHHNALDMKLYLRIAPELYLKRLTVGGMARVFEINRNFRNEGISTQHNPEFTMLEFYQAYAEYQGLMALTETLVEEVATAVVGKTDVEFNGHTIALQGPWRRLSLRDNANAADYFAHPERRQQPRLSRYPDEMCERPRRGDLSQPQTNPKPAEGFRHSVAAVPLSVSLFLHLQNLSLVARGRRACREYSSIRPRHPSIGEHALDAFRFLHAVTSSRRE